MFFKKFLPLTLIVSITFSMLFTFSAFADTTPGNQNGFLVNQWKSIDIYNGMLNVFNKQFNGGYPKDYAGAYIDDQGFLNINIVSIKNSASQTISIVKSITDNDNIKYHNVKYSFEELQEIMDILNIEINEIDVKGIGLMEKENKVYIYVDSLDEAHISKVKKIIDCPAIEFKEQKGNAVAD